MDSCKPCTACAGAGPMHCDTGILCGSLAPVVYVPVPVFATDVCHQTFFWCGNTGETRTTEGTDQGVGFDNMQATHGEKLLNQDAINADEAKRLFCVGECSICANHPTDSNANNIFRHRLCTAGGHHLLNLSTSHGRIVYRNAMTCCERGHIPGVASDPVLGERNIPRTAVDTSRETSLKGSNFEGVTGSTRHRRLSSDSGRITWSDSGESIFSDVQGGGDTFRRTCTTTPKTFASTSQSHFFPTPVMAMSTPSTSTGTAWEKPEGVPQSPIDMTNRRIVIPTFPVNDQGTFSHPLTPRSHYASGPSERFRTRLPSAPPRREKTSQEESHEEKPGLQYTRIVESKLQMPNDLEIKPGIDTAPETPRLVNSQRPRRSNSEWALRKTRRQTTKQAPNMRLRCLEEDGLSAQLEFSRSPRRPRSRSLFGIADSTTTHRTGTPPRSPTQVSKIFQSGDIDFTTWRHVSQKWEVGSESPSKENIKAYGLAAVPGLNGFAVTDADKVKIKIYGMDGEMRISFGTPTWPRYGRGITLTPDGKHLAVCHLSEVCTYTLDGVFVDRFVHENMRACWGITLNADGNFVVTDPKSSSVIILTPSGQLTELIGGNIPKPPSRKQSKNKSRLRNKSTKSTTSSSSKATNSPLNEPADNDSIKRSSNMSLPTGSEAEDSPFGLEDKKKVRLLAPRYVAVNSKNQILVTDTRQRCLLVFEKDGTHLFSIGGGRAGCNKCHHNEDMSRDIAEMVTTTDFWPMTAMVSPIQRDALPRQISDLSIPISTNEKSRTTSASNYFGEICGTRMSCMSKSKRKKTVGALYRHEVGRNDSVESEAYQAISLRGIPVQDREEEPHITACLSPSLSVGNRLGSPTTNQFGRVSSCNNIADTNANKQLSLKMKKMKLKKPSWMKRPNKKNKKNSAPPIARCDSFDQISEGGSWYEDPAADLNWRNMSPGTKSKQLHSPLSIDDAYTTPTTHMTSFTFGSTKGGSEPTTPRELRTPEDCRSAVLKFHSIGDLDYVPDFSPVTKADSEDDEDRSACRKCHIEDPRGVCVDRNDNILLVDRARHRVTVFTPTGHFVRHILTEEHGIHEPMTVCVLNDNSIAVTDSSSCVKIFQFLCEF